ncbi:hypothetical protein NMY22_g12482 [Coprinellus aureogranulatus]|nr:hypothetical protein NMY22_g12482 [Coprinellus aureogranulatus]
MPSASNTLKHHLRTLIAQLPVENRDLMRTVVELVTATAKASKETKMPLSNLLLVFCPSLNMSPPLLKALCEAEGIWDETAHEEVLHIKRENSADSVNRGVDEYSDAQDGSEFDRQSFQSVDQPPSEHPSSGYNASAENSMVEDLPPSSSKTAVFDRKDVPTVYLDSHSQCSSSSLSSQGDIERVSRRDVLSPPLLSSESADSLVTPVSSGHPSVTHLPLQDFKKEPLIKKASARDLKTKISHPILIDTGMVQFPPSPPTPQKRRSIPILSLPSFSSPPQQEEATESPNPGLRGKKPSLRRLFTKHSMASIGSGSSGGKRRMSIFNSTELLDSPHYTPHSASDSSVSTPLSAVTAPQQSSTSLPPVLDTPIEGGSSLSLSLGINVSPPNSAASPTLDTATTGATSFASARSSQFSFGPSTGSSHEADAGHNGPYRQRMGSFTSVASSNHLGLLDDDDQEDWTQSVLIAAGAN